MDAGGSLTGEHGSGSTRRSRHAQHVRSDDQRCAAFGSASTRQGSPTGQASPTPRLCGEVPGPTGHTPREARACRASLKPEPLAIAQAAEILAQATREGRRVSIDRAGGDLVVSTRYLNRLLEHEAVTSRPPSRRACAFSTLNERLAEHGQMLALDPRGLRRSVQRSPATSSAARPPVRPRARPRPRRDRRPRRRHRCERRRQGSEERRRVRPRQALLRLARAPGLIGA